MLLPSPFQLALQDFLKGLHDLSDGFSGKHVSVTLIVDVLVQGVEGDAEAVDEFDPVVSSRVAVVSSQHVEATGLTMKAIGHTDEVDVELLLGRVSTDGTRQVR